MQKAAIAISSNLIGSGDGDKINNFLKSATILHLIIIIVLALPLIVFADKLIILFDIDYTSLLYKQCVVSLFFVWVFFIFGNFDISGRYKIYYDNKF